MGGGHRSRIRQSLLPLLATTFWTCILLCLPRICARNFTLRNEIRGDGFYDSFYWWNYGDPTHGTVDYVSKRESQSLNLSYVDASTGNFIMRADDASIASPSSSGRKSVRIHSIDKLQDGVVAMRVKHMPSGCGTWPAFWTCTTSNWPAGGEIDIVEGASDQGPRNLASLHTTAGCTIPAGNSSISTGFTGQTDCQYQPGCSESFSLSNSFGPAFNQNGGGWFVMVRDTSPISSTSNESDLSSSTTTTRLPGPGISIYFYPSSTSSTDLPSFLSTNRTLPFVLTGLNATNPALGGRSDENWGRPAAFFPTTPTPALRAIGSSNTTDDAPSCPMDRYFDEHEIIINLTFCGYWAGETFPYVSTCPKNTTCDEYVRNNPQAFSEARWEIEKLLVYTDGASRVAASSRIWTLGIGFLLACIISCW
ncbi:hypothetical protein IE81DRAFT_321952 [Ceraceosorus guamensis]|uniref:GH16 domain-containing protein n=1 Tax=Ceraceosorus guamensis TaxID=1522189 RepID=A0A316W3W1_9BASI|nr:hypothetical protein IE81DRAFT_321952 [Ceraceosorus guamensis]PWN43788.1 hypothetical protein IE81DRAFT_321952 [Ceraceosorus guamensis]